MEVGIYTYITANIIYTVQELYLGDKVGCFSLQEKLLLRCSLNTSFPVFIATSKCVVNNLSTYSSRTQPSCLLLVASWSWRCYSACNKKGPSQNVWISVGGDNASCSHTPVRSSSVKKWGVWIGSSPAPTVLCPTQCKNWHGLHKSSYCYCVSYVGTCNCHLDMVVEFSWVFVIQTTLGTTLINP